MPKTSQSMPLLGLCDQSRKIAFLILLLIVSITFKINYLLLFQIFAIPHIKTNEARGLQFYDLGKKKNIDFQGSLASDLGTRGPTSILTKLHFISAQSCYLDKWFLLDLSAVYHLYLFFYYFFVVSMMYFCSFPLISNKRCTQIPLIMYFKWLIYLYQNK